MRNNHKKEKSEKNLQPSYYLVCDDFSCETIVLQVRLWKDVRDFRSAQIVLNLYKKHSTKLKFNVWGKNKDDTCNSSGKI